METNVSARRSFLATHSIVLANSPPSKAREISPILGNHCYFVYWLLDMVCLIMTNTKVELSMYSKLTRQTPCNQLRLSSHSYAQFDPGLPQESRKGQWASVMLAWKRCITTQSSPCDLRGSAKEQPCHGFLKFGGCHMSWADSVRTTHRQEFRAAVEAKCYWASATAFGQHRNRSSKISSSDDAIEETSALSSWFSRRQQVKAIPSVDRLGQANGPLGTWSFMTFCLHANQKTVSCGTWENSSSWKPCIPQRFPKICCTHGPHIGSKSFLPELSGLLGFCRVPQLANSLIKYVHVHRCKHEYIYTYIIYIYTWTRYIDRDTSCYRHISHQCNMARPALQSSNLHRNSWLFHKVVSYVRTARRWKERVNQQRVKIMRKETKVLHARNIISQNPFRGLQTG